MLGLNAVPEVLWLAGLSVLVVWALITIYNTRAELDQTDVALDDLSERADHLNGSVDRAIRNIETDHARLTNLENFTTKPDSDLNQILGSLSSRIDKCASNDSLKSVHVDLLKRLDSVLALIESEQLQEEEKQQDDTPLPDPDAVLRALLLGALSRRGILRGSATRG